MISRWVRTWMPGVIRPVVERLLRMGVTPNGLTLAGLLVMALAGLALASGWLKLAALGLLVSGVLDSLDGELARHNQDDERLGGFIDSVADHYGDFGVYLGLAWWALERGDRLVVLLGMLAMFGSLAGSHIRARAAMAGIDTKAVGMFTRAERTLVWIFGLFTGWLVPMLVVLAVGSNVSAGQRLWFALRGGPDRQQECKPQAAGRDAAKPVDAPRP